MENKIDRRSFVTETVKTGAGIALALGAGSSLFGQSVPAKQDAVKKIEMIKLPYPENALAPFISARTVNLHYYKHHQGYYDLLRKFIETHPEYQNQSLEDILLKLRTGEVFDDISFNVFNVAVLLYNHNWYWQSLTPKGDQPLWIEIGWMDRPKSHGR